MLKKNYFPVFGAGGDVFPGAGELFPLFVPEDFPVVLGPLAGRVVPFDISFNIKMMHTLFYAFCSKKVI